jgi:FlaA1/EpsC-like NDP-sugar epimerase
MFLVTGATGHVGRAVRPRSMKAVDARELSRVIVDTTVQEVDAIASELNERPRKVLNFLPPRKCSSGISFDRH